MRRPTTPEEALTWWRSAIAGGKPQITHEPQPGWYKRRLIREGPWVGARIWIEYETDEAGELTAPEQLVCEVNGQRRDAAEQWTYLAGYPITEREFLYLRDTHRWATHHAPDEPHANPEQKVDHLKTPLPF